MDITNLHQRFCNYAGTFKGNSKRSVLWFRDIMRRYLKYSKITTLEELTRESIGNWIFYGKAERNWAPKTIRNHLQSISLFMDWCVKEEYIPENPLKKIPKPRLPKKVPKHLSKEDALHLLEWAKNFPYSYKYERTRGTAILAMFIFTGVRREELRNLKFNEVDIQNRTVFIKSGKGDKDRLIPMNQRLLEILQEYVKDRQRLKKTCPYFFTAMREDKRMGDLVIKRLVLKLREKSKIYFYLHLLRHTFATLMLEGGCDLFSLSKMLGHSDIKTTTIYLSATTAHLQVQIEKHPLNNY